MRVKGKRLAAVQQPAQAVICLICRQPGFFESRISLHGLVASQSLEQSGWIMLRLQSQSDYTGTRRLTRARLPGPPGPYKFTSSVSSKIDRASSMPWIFNRSST